MGLFCWWYREASVSRSPLGRHVGRFCGRDRALAAYLREPFHGRDPRRLYGAELPQARNAVLAYLEVRVRALGEQHANELCQLALAFHFQIL